MNRTIIKIYIYLALLFLALPQCVDAQQVVKTVIPCDAPFSGGIIKDGTPWDLDFDLAAVPHGAVVDSANLVLVLAADVPVSQASVRVALHPADRMVNSRLFRLGQVKDEVVNIPVKKAYDPAVRRVNLRLSVPTGFNSTAKLQFYTGKDSSSGKVARMVVYYHYNYDVPAWAGLRADARHSATIPVRLTAPVATSYSVTRLDIGNIRSELVMNNDQAYLVAANSNRVSIMGIDEAALETAKKAGSSPVSWQVNVGVNKAAPIIDGNGNIYCIDENRALVVKPGSKTVDTIDIYKNRGTLCAQPVMGSDGSLYMPYKVIAGAGGGSNIIYAYSPLPAVRELWVCRPGGNVGSPALDAVGNMAYIAVYGNNGDNISGISTTDGRILYRAPVTLRRAGQTEGATMPMVSNNGYIYMPNKLFGADSMYVFDHTLQRVAAYGDTVSAPACGADSAVYFVKGNNLVMAYPHSHKILGTCGRAAAVRSLVADRSGNVYCLQETGSRKQLYVYNSATDSVTEPYNLDINGGVERAMIAVPNGDLLLCTTNELVRLRPVYSTDITLDRTAGTADGASTSAGANVTLASGYEARGHKTIVATQSVKNGGKATISSGAKVKIQAGNSIGLGAGFNVQKGGSLACKTGN